MAQPRFLSGQEVNIVLGNTSILALLTLGEAMVIISRNVDLSVGSVLGLSAYVSGSMFGHLHGMPTSVAIVVAFLVGIGVGAACGIVNGALTTIGRVPSLVVTLATLYIIRGIDILIIGGGQVVASSLPERVLPDLAQELPQRSVSHARGRRRDRDRCLLPALVPLGPRPVRDRFEPGRGAARRDPERAEGVHRVRAERVDRRRAGRALGVEVRHARLDRRHRATSCR